MKKIHYICPYIDDNLFGEYNIALSGKAKIAYIKQCLLELGYEINLFSPIKCVDDFSFIKRRKIINISLAERHFYPYSIGGKNTIIKSLSYAIIYLQLIVYLIFSVKKNDVVLLYHALPETSIVLLINRILKRRIILELEELYSARTLCENKIDKEKGLVRNTSDGYIVVNSVIHKRCGISKPIVVCEGQYGMISLTSKSLKDNNGIINIVYSGIFRDNEDVFVAVESTKYLNSNYKLHICGYGDQKVIEHLKKQIAFLNLTNGCQIEFYGSLGQDEYEILMKKCSVGICPRLLEDKLSDYEFPSKILAYLSRNIIVVCSPISCVRKSQLAKSIVFSKSNQPKDFADAILQHDKETLIDYSQLLKEQDERFIVNMKQLIS